MKTHVPFIDLKAAHQQIKDDIDAAVGRVSRSGWYLLGPELERFEGGFAEYCGTRHCVGVSSGLSAIELILRSVGIGEGDEVIVPAYTWIATWLAVSRTGAHPVPVDVCKETYNLDPDLLATAITPRTAGIVPVHLRGEPANMPRICDVAKKHDLFVVEDAAQAHGASINGKRVGGFGSAAAFSFYPSKNLGALGDGGAVVTDSDEIAERVRLLRNYGMKDRYELELEGTNSRLAEIQAAVLTVKLRHLDKWNDARRGVADRYTAAFEEHPAISLPQAPAWADPVWHLYVIGCSDRDDCAHTLSTRGIETLVHYPILPHQAEPYTSLGWHIDSMPVAEELSAAALSLPIYPQLEPEMRERVVDAVLIASR